MRVRTRIIPVSVRASYTPEQIVAKGILILFALVGLIDLITAGALWK